MKAMILAAGAGTRLKPLTRILPKPLIPVLGKPVMEYLVEELARHGFDRIMVNVSHFAAAIESYFGDGRRFGVEIGYSFEGAVRDGEVVARPLGSAGGIRRVQDFAGFFDDTFLVVCADALIDLDLAEALRRHRRSGAAASLAVARVAPARIREYGVVVADERGRVVSFQEKPSAAEALSDRVNAGVYVFEPRVLELIPRGQTYDVGAQLFPRILETGLGLNAIEMPFNWIDIGRLSDYWEAMQRLMRGALKRVRMPGVESAPGVWCGLDARIDWAGARLEGPVYVGSGAEIRAGAEIVGPTWIGRGCRVEGGARVRRGIVLDYTRVGPRASLSEALAFGRDCVDREGNPVPGLAPGEIGDVREERVA